MEQARAIITIVETPVGDGIHTQLACRCEIDPPMGEHDDPSMAAMAAMVALDAITRQAEKAGGGVQDVQTFSTHDGQPEWWS